jgi:hypothetical protein
MYVMVSIRTIEYCAGAKTRPFVRHGELDRTRRGASCIPPLRPLGIEPLHTYHYGESLDWLKRLRDAADYLALGGTAHLSVAERRAWFDAIMPYLADDSGAPIYKPHGFGLTSFDTGEQYIRRSSVPRSCR